MTDYLPEAYRRFGDQFPTVAAALDALGQATEQDGPLDERARRLVKLGIAVGALAESAVRSKAREALDDAATVDELYDVALLAVTTRGLPAAIAGIERLDEVVHSRT